MASLTPGQRSVLRHLINGRTNAEIAETMGYTPQRAAAVVTALEAKGYITTIAPEDIRLIHPQQSRAHPWPPAARWCRLFPYTSAPIIIRSVLLPRTDGLELPHGLPDQRAVVIDIPDHDPWSFVAPRAGRWSLQQSMERMDVVVPALDYANSIDVYRELTRGLAWCLEAEAIMYDPAELPFS